MFLEEKRRKKMLSINDGTLEKNNTYKILLLKSKTPTAKLKHLSEVEADPKQHAGMKKKFFLSIFFFSVL